MIIYIYLPYIPDARPLPGGGPDEGDLPWKTRISRFLF